MPAPVVITTSRWCHYNFYCNFSSISDKVIKLPKLNQKSNLTNKLKKKTNSY